MNSPLWGNGVAAFFATFVLICCYNSEAVGIANNSEFGEIGSQ
jgi:hypothetical protein